MLLNSAALNTHVPIACSRRTCRSHRGRCAAVAKALRQQRPFDTDSTTLESRTTRAKRQPGIVKTLEGRVSLPEPRTSLPTLETLGNVRHSLQPLRMCHPLHSI